MPLTDDFIRKNAMASFLATIDEIGVVTGPSSIDKDTSFGDLVNFRSSADFSTWIQTSREVDSVVGFVEGPITLLSSQSYTHVILAKAGNELMLTTPLSISPSFNGDRRVRVKVTMKEVPF